LYITPKEGFENTVQCFGEHRIAFYLSPDALVSSASFVLDRYIKIISADDPDAASGKLDGSEYVSKWVSHHSPPSSSKPDHRIRLRKDTFKTVQQEDDTLDNPDTVILDQFYAGPKMTISGDHVASVRISTLMLAINALAAEIFFEPGFSVLKTGCSSAALSGIADIIISMDVVIKVEGRYNTVTKRGRIINDVNTKVIVFEEGCSIHELSFRRACVVTDLLVSLGVSRDLLMPVAMQDITPITLDKDILHLNRKVCFVHDA
jgi:hypothetical protein